MENSTIIDSKNYVISSAESSVAEISYDGNKNIQYLPASPYSIFPNLTVLSAANCSIKEISNLNFKMLYKLEKIKLPHNQLEEILSDTFDGLDQLIFLDLGKTNFQLH